MANQSIFIESNSIKYKLVFNETLLLITKSDTIRFTIPETGAWEFNINFIEDDEKSVVKLESDNELKKIKITCNNFYSANYWIENSAPSILTFSDKTNYNIKIGSSAKKDADRNLRTVTISIWQQQQ